MDDAVDHLRLRRNLASTAAGQALTADRSLAVAKEVEHDRHCCVLTSY